MNILLWHVHGAWLTAFVQGPHEYLVPVMPGPRPGRAGPAPDLARGRDSVREVTPEQLRSTDVDVVVLQRPHELELCRRWTGLAAGVDVPAVYVEHDTPARRRPGRLAAPAGRPGRHPARARHPLQPR